MKKTGLQVRKVAQGHLGSELIDRARLALFHTVSPQDILGENQLTEGY